MSRIMTTENLIKRKEFVISNKSVPIKYKEISAVLVKSFAIDKLAKCSRKKTNANIDSTDHKPLEINPQSYNDTLYRLKDKSLHKNMLLKNHIVENRKKEINLMGFISFLIIIISFPMIDIFISTPVHSECTPSDPFGTNPDNLCPEGFAFAFSDSFEPPRHVRGELYIGKPIQPGVPGTLVEELNDRFYTSISVQEGSGSEGIVRTTSTKSTKLRSHTSSPKAAAIVKERLKNIPR